MGLPRASPVNPPKQAQAATDGATMRVYLAPEVRHALTGSIHMYMFGTQTRLVMTGLQVEVDSQD